MTGDLLNILTDFLKEIKRQETRVIFNGQYSKWSNISTGVNQWSLLEPIFFLTLIICIKWVPGDPSTIFLATNFSRKMPESSDSMYSSIFMLENIWYHHFTWSAQNSQEIVNYAPIQFGSRGTHDWNNSHNFLWIRSALGKIIIYVF